MSEMVERVALAIWKDRQPDEEWSELEKLNYMGHARAAITAMHEPNDEMLQIGQSALEETGSILDVYAAMMSKAYSEEFAY